MKYKYKIGSFKRKESLKNLVLRYSGFVLLFYPFASLATSELSTRLVFIQIFNFSLFAIGLFFLLKKPVQVLFHNRQKNFFAFEKQAFELEKQKKEENQKWEKKVSVLREKEKNIKKKAEEEGNRFRREKLQELKEIENKLKTYANFLIQLETEKIKRQQLNYWKKELIQNVRSELQELNSSFQEQEEKIFLDFLQNYKKRI
ncbi:MAG: hypothetical protein GDA46_01425 [Bdellovibrionales bacterium]|nr:hypothetical protein [Bdellovibrionales bacterium]